MHREPIARRPVRDVLLLTLLCVPVFLIFPTRHGLTNWQEAQRVLVARDMERRGQWIVPTVDGQAYLAKPPMIYWVQRGLARLRGGRVGELDLRLSVALAAYLGVLATYIVARRLLRDDDAHDRGIGSRAWADTAAWWAALFLAGGILYVRSGRIGELDILLVPFVVIGVGATARAWDRWRRTGRTDWIAVAVSVAAASGAALTKGPPGLVVPILAPFGAMILYPAARSLGGCRRSAAIGAAGGAAGGAAVMGVALLLIHASGPAPTLNEWIGAGLFLAIGAAVGAMAVVAAKGRVPRPAMAAWSRTHPLLVLVVPIGVLWGWSRMVSARIGPSADIVAAVGAEAADNLLPLVLNSPLKNLEASAYGVGLGSLAAFVALLWLIRDRPRLGPGAWIVVAWVVLGVATFALIGKGVGRYLTPVWPGIAMLGGMWVATALTQVRHPRRLGRMIGTVAVALALGQGWWYAKGRERYVPQRSPRAMIAELKARPDLANATIVTLGFHSPAVAFYADQPVPTVGDNRMGGSSAVAQAWSIDELRDRVHSGATIIVLARTGPVADDSRSRSPAALLRDLGLRVEPITTGARYEIDSGRSQIAALLVRSAVQPAQ